MLREQEKVKTTTLFLAASGTCSHSSFTQLTQQKCSPYFPLSNPSSLCEVGVRLQILANRGIRYA